MARSDARRRTVPLAVGAGTAAVAIGALDGWRTLLIASVAAGAVAATRIRYAAVVAVVVLAVVGGAAAVGFAIAGDERPRAAGDPWHDDLRTRHADRAR